MRSVTHMESSTSGVAVAGEAGIFRGWIVLAGIFLAMTAGSGFAFYAQGIFLDALVDEQGFSVGLAGAGTGTFFFVSGVSGYYAGGLIDRFDIRVVMTIGVLIAAAGMALVGEVRAEWQMFAVFVIFGGGYALAGLVPTTSLVTRWFSRRRSLALAIASTGLSMGAIAISPFIGQLVEDRSLVTVAPWLAVAFIAVMLPVIWILVRPSPEAMGLRPDGDPAPAETSASDGPPVLPGTAFADAVSSGYFQVLSITFVLVMAAQVGALQHLFKLTKDQVDVDGAGLALMVVAGTSVAARIVGGLAAMRFALRHLTSVLIVVQAIGIAIIGLADGLGTILVGCVVLGSAMGNLLMLHPLLLAEAFGVREYSRIYGLGALLMVFGVGLGPFIVGVIRDALDYQSAFLVMAVVAMVGLAVFALAPDPPSPESAPSPPTEPIAPAEPASLSLTAVGADQV